MRYASVCSGVEIWKDIPNCHGKYKASNMGRIASIKPSGFKILRQCSFRTGYLRVSIFGKSRLVHRLVAITFIDNPCNLPCINHKDENKTNNMVVNLEWCDTKYNNSYGERLNKVRQANSVPIIAIKDGCEKEFPSLSECVKSLHLNQGHVCEVLHGKRKQCKGYSFRNKR